MKDNCMATKILLIDDHTLFRSGLRALLDQQSDFIVVGEAADGVTGIQLAAQLKPDVVLLDLDMPVMSGREVLPQLLCAQPELAILILTISESNVDLTECMRIGAEGYLLKNIDMHFLINSIRRATMGDNILSPEMTSALINNLRKLPSNKQNVGLEMLTPREKETLIWLAKGVSNKEIARSLSLTESTIKVHVQNMLRKLKLHSRVQAAVYAIEHGLDKQD